ncbi:MAG: 1-acyl-sn-glycerol-3-phosphate acyltransferase [Syntrophobacteria bacterium]
MTRINGLIFSLSKLGIRAVGRLFKASIHVCGTENIPNGVTIFMVNHFTRLETLILAHEFYKITGRPVMSLAYHGLFTGALGTYLENVGAVSTKDPDRDKTIVCSLLTGDHSWLMFPEGAMIKDKKIIERGKFLIYSATGSRRPPHTGAAALALRAEFYRQRLRRLEQTDPPLLSQQLEVFGLDSPEQVTDRETFLVPVNVSYYPIRSRQNAIDKLASYLVRDIPERFREELQTEGTMLLSGVDMDIRLGKPLPVKPWLNHRRIQRDIVAPRPIQPDEVLPSRPLVRKIASRLTVQAMASIYSMTTVNHDHLAAYLLKYYPGHRLSIFDLAERLYMASKAALRLKGIRLHGSLHQDQCVQLCRQYPRKLADFLQAAKNSGVVEVEENTIHRKQGKITPAFNFHTVRRDNPYQVILNEVECLRPLTRRLRLIARQPRCLMRWKLRRRFRRLDRERFVADYNAYRRDGETKPMHIGAPFLLRRFRARAGVLLVHGYMAAPQEVRPLAGYLHKHRYMVYAPRLRGTVPPPKTWPSEPGKTGWSLWSAAI